MSKGNYNKVVLPIRFKILAMVGVLLVGAVCFYTWLASTIFKQEKIALLYDINHSTAVNTAAQLRSYFIQVGNVLRFHTLAELTTKQKSWALSKQTLKASGILNTAIYKGTKARELASGSKIGISEEQLKQLSTHDYAVWTVPPSENSSTLFIATHVSIAQNNTKQRYIAIAGLDADAFVSTVQSSTLFSTFIVRRNGDILLQGDREEIRATKYEAPHPLKEELASHKSGHSGVATYQFAGAPWYGGYAPVGVAGLYVVSQAGQEQMNTALEVLVKRSLLFGLIVITATFLISILFSRRLTKNLHQLSETAHKIGEGDLNAKIDVRSGDEVQTLANTFNQMVDALKESREAIERHNRELEHKVDERTKEIQEKNLAIEQIQEKLIKSTQLAAAGEIAGRTAHEVLNPLTAIVGRLERVRQYVANQQSPPAEQLLDILSAWEKEYTKGGVEQLSKNLSSPSELIEGGKLIDEDLKNLKELALYWLQQHEQLGGDLHFVKDQAGRIQRIVDGMRELVRSSTLKEEASCHEAIETATLTVKDLIENSGVTLETKLKAESDVAVLNKDELVQILTNLIRNSFQSIQDAKTEAGKISIETSIEAQNLYIDITDNGPGISIEQKDSIFDQGFTTKPPSEGTGLGLPISRRYARAFGGDVVLVYSEPKDSTCFRIVVPLAHAQEIKMAS